MAVSLEWQPIETAPRDGTVIVLACFGSYPTRMAWVALVAWRECRPYPSLSYWYVQGAPPGLGWDGAPARYWLGRPPHPYGPTHWAHA